MEQRLVCDTVRDLLPMYIDHMTSEASNESIEGHMENCQECRDALEQMRSPVRVEAAPEVKDFRKFLKKSKMSLLYWMAGAAALIAIVACFIVNLAVDQRLSWFYIVGIGIVTAYLPAYVWITASKHRFVKGLAVLSICVFLVVGTVQIVLYYLMGIGEMWFWEIGLPVTVLWLVIVWAGVAFHGCFHTNALISLSVITFLAVPGNYLTQCLTGDCQGIHSLDIGSIADGMGNGLAAVLLLLAGLAWQRRKGKKEDGE